MKHKILVTGGAGYIGTHTVVELIKAGHELVVVDNFSNSSKKSLEAVEKIIGQSITLYEADICDKEALQIWETLNSSETFRNPQALYTNVWFNRWGIVASCNFVNCVKFVVK